MNKSNENLKGKVQDDSRENEMRQIFGLMENGGRIDADAKDEYNHLYELKSTSKSGVSTARDFSFQHIEKGKALYWVFGKGRNIIKNGNKKFIFDEFWFCTGDSMLKPFWDKWEKTLKERKKLVDKALKELDWNKEDKEKFKTFCYRGIKQNDPNIPFKSIIKEYGQQIDMTRPREHLRELVEKYPLN